jgi:hypothetical protein
MPPLFSGRKPSLWSTDPPPPDNAISCRVVHQNFEGPFVTMVLKTADQTLIRMRRNNDGTGRLPSLNEPVLVTVRPENIRVLGRETIQHDLSS